jgi:lipid II:glycine glycyltransferase (peptidoglycan interpeptide bridge formation enzyme)
MITFTDSTNNEQWDIFVKNLPRYSFLNSFARIKYLKETGQKEIQKYIEKDGEKIGILAGSISKTRFGEVLDLKHAPLLLEKYSKNKDIWLEVLNALKDLGKELGCFSVRVTPLEMQNDELTEAYKELKAVESPIHNVDALISQYIDVTKTEEELRHDMSSSTRNNINKLMKNPDVSVKIFNDDSMFNTFADFHKQTRKVKGFTDKPMEILLKELKIQVDMGMHYMVVGYYKNKPISIWTLTKFGKYGSIYQAGSDTEFREKKIRITYLLAWESIKYAKELGLEVLDLFGGMVPEGCTKHPWLGVNNFKESLGGTKVTYMHCRDLVINPFEYWLFYMYSIARNVYRGYPVKW